MLKNFLKPEDIRQATEHILTMSVEYKKSITIYPEKGEKEVIAIAYEVEEHIYLGLAVLDADDKIVRFENIRPVNEVSTKIISKL